MDSLLGAVADQRRADRHLTVLMVGKVRGPFGEYACVINDVSAHGLKARFPRPPQVGERLVFGLRGIPEVSATVRWTDGLRGGVEFDDPLDLAKVLAHHGTTHIPRAPRFACERPTSVIIDDRGYAADLLDVSLGGAKLALCMETPDFVGRSAALLLPGLDSIRAGTICWVDEGRLGLRFLQPLTLDEITVVLPAFHNAAARPCGSAGPDA